MPTHNFLFFGASLLLKLLDELIKIICHKITDRNGNCYSEAVQILKGAPGKPASMKDVAQKFRQCAAYSAKPMPEENIEGIIKLVSNLENVADVAGLIKLFKL